MKRIVYHVGGPEFHPVNRRAREIATWLGNEKYQRERFDGDYA